MRRRTELPADFRARRSKPQAAVRSLREADGVALIHFHVGKRFFRKDDPYRVADLAELEFEDHGSSVATDVITRKSGPVQPGIIIRDDYRRAVVPANSS